MMNTKSTWIWLVFATALFAFIVAFDHYQHPAVPPVQSVLPGLHPAAVTSVQVIPAGVLEIRADHDKNSWWLAKPFIYPAQPAAIEALLTALQNLKTATRISAGEVQTQHTADADFGFDTPQDSLVITAGDQRWRLLVGHRTAPGDQVFLRVVGVAGAFVTDAGWLKFIPHSASDWRSTALVDADVAGCDAIVLTNNSQVIELRRDPTNQLWRMIQPLSARADNDRITDALQQLLAAQASQFVTDDGKTDLTQFGLQPASLDLWFKHGTNLISALHVGKTSTNDAALVYAKRERWDAVFTTAMAPLSPWRGTVNDFRDPHLFELTSPVSEIEKHGAHDFTLQLQGTNGWQVVGEKFPVDEETVQSFIKALASLRVAQFVTDTATAPDFAAHGLIHPQDQITLRTKSGDSNAVIAELDFSVETNGVFVRHADEPFIYAITPEDGKILFGGGSLFESGWQFRDRHIWHFTAKDVAQITLQQNGKTRQLIHNGANKWSPSWGIIEPHSIEETVYRLGDLAAVGWIGRNVTNPDHFGLNTNNLAITVELKNGEKRRVDFGLEKPSDHTALAAVTLDGERWAFVFPPVLYQFVLSYLTIPANAP
jgi:hypothetical protein